MSFQCRSTGKGTYHVPNRFSALSVSWPTLSKLINVLLNHRGWIFCVFGSCTGNFGYKKPVLESCRKLLTWRCRPWTYWYWWVSFTSTRSGVRCRLPTSVRTGKPSPESCRVDHEGGLTRDVKIPAKTNCRTKVWLRGSKEENNLCS